MKYLTIRTKECLRTETIHKEDGSVWPVGDLFNWDVMNMFILMYPSERSPCTTAAICLGLSAADTYKRITAMTTTASTMQT